MLNTDNKKNSAFGFNTLLFLLVILLGLVSRPSFAAEVETVQVGTTTVTSTTKSVSISPVTDSKSILIFNLTTHSTTSGPQDTHVRGQLTCNSGICNAINFKRYGTGSNVTIRWQVLEFTDASSVTVQRGITTQSSMGGSPPSKTISTGVNSAKSFVLLSEFVHGSVTSDDDFTRGQINSAGNLVLSVGEKKYFSSSAEIAWQVIEYQDANIQSGNVSFATVDASKTIAISSVDLGKTLLVYNYYSTGKSSDNPVCQNLVSGTISSASTLQFERGCANHNGEILLSWFAIEFTDASIVQHNKLVFSNSELSKTVTLSNAVDTSCAITTTGYHQRGGRSPATVDHTSSAWFNAGLNAAGDEITLSRGQTNGVSAETGWFVVEFEGCGSAVPVPTNKCFAMADDAAELYSFDLDISTPVNMVNTTKTFNGEAAAYRAADNALYTFDQTVKSTTNPSDLYKVELDGSTSLVATGFIPNRAAGAEFVQYADGTEQFIVLMNENDSVIQMFDASNLASKTLLGSLALIFPDGSNASVDSLAINPNSGEILVVDAADDAADFPEIYSVDMNTGQLSLKVTLSVPGIDAESLAFAEDGNLYLENESSKTPAAYDYRIYKVDLTSGTVTAVEENINSIVSGDIEGMSCTGSKIITPKLGSSISGSVFKDANGNDLFDSGESKLSDISVWLQLINADGTIDPVKVPATTNTLGNYQLNGIADGNYQVHVDTTDVDLPTDHQLGGNNPLLITVNDTDISNADFPYDEVACSAFSGEVTEVGLPISSQLKTGDKLFVPSRSVSSATGHLRAYSIDHNGVPATTAEWDAASPSKMTDRATKLFSSDTNGNIVLFNALDTGAFSSTSVATLKAHSIASVLGGISRGNSLDILSNSMNTSLYLYDTVYRDFYTSTVSPRSKQVLMSSDDGFLYAFDYESGNLLWAWMPRSLVSELTGLADFQGKHLMAGAVDILDLKDSSGSYASYIIGSYKSGLGYYALKLAANGSLDQVVWDVDQSSAFVKSPNQGELEYFKDASGIVHAAYVLTNSVNTSRIVIKSLTDSSPAVEVNLNYETTSTPFVMQDYGKSNAPAKMTLYMGTATGDIHSAALLTTDGDIEDAATIKAELEGPAVASMNDSPTDPVTYIGSSIAAKDNQYYLSAQTPTRLTVLRYDSSDSSWHRAWSSYSSGARSWNQFGTYSDYTGSVPSDQGGFAIVPPATGIQGLPVDAAITAKVTIVADTIVLPLTVLAASSATCYGKAYYYMYSLSDGSFPKTSFVKTDNTAIVTDIALGYGEAGQLTISDLLGKDQLLGYGLADKKEDLSIGLGSPFIIKDPVATGIRGWKEIGR